MEAGTAEERAVLNGLCPVAHGDDAEQEDVNQQIRGAGMIESPAGVSLPSPLP